MADTFSVIGRPRPRVDAMEQTMGRTMYTDDLKLSGMLVGRLLPSTQALAVIKSIDTSGAEELDGVKAVITGADLPITYGILPISQDENALATDRVRYIGEPVAAVAAIDAQTAQRALDLIDVRFEPLESRLLLDCGVGEIASITSVSSRASQPLYRKGLRACSLFADTVKVLMLHHCCSASKLRL